MTLLRGIKNGESTVDRALSGSGSGTVVGGVCGKGGGFGIRDKRFILRASVGLIVLAPNPDAWPGICDILLFEPGVPCP